MTSRTELRNDRNTAAHIARALKLQQQCGYDYARSHLHSVGVPDDLARRLLAIRFDRRQAAATPAPRTTLTLQGVTFTQ